MSAASPRLIAGTPAAQGRSILLSASVLFLTGPGNSATDVFSCANPHLSVILRIHLLTVCHICTGMHDAPVAAAATMLCTKRAVGGVILALSNVCFR